VIARLLLTVTLGACVSRPAPGPADRPDASEAETGAAITLERTACFGECPVYRIAVSPAGRVTYEGSANVRRIGTASAQIAPDQVHALLVELERAGYFTFASRYAASEPTCRRHSTDSPTAISSATFKGRTKRIEHDYGCGGVPGALTVMEKRIDEVLGSEQWTGR
jgi:Domain of unknown function (DUF6438)